MATRRPTVSEQGLCGPSVVPHSCSTGLKVSGMRLNKQGGTSVCVVLEIKDQDLPPVGLKAATASPLMDKVYCNSESQHIGHIRLLLQ